MRGFSNSHKGNVTLNPIPRGTIRKRSTIRSIDDSLFISSIDWHWALSDRLRLRLMVRAKCRVKVSEADFERGLWLSSGKVFTFAIALLKSRHPSPACCESGEMGRLIGTRSKSVRGQGYAFVSGEEWRSQHLVA
jgi:hypothetical protein